MVTPSKLQSYFPFSPQKGTSPEVPLIRIYPAETHAHRKMTYAIFCNIILIKDERKPIVHYAIFKKNEKVLCVYRHGKIYM